MIQFFSGSSFLDPDLTRSKIKDMASTVQMPPVNAMSIRKPPNESAFSTSGGGCLRLLLMSVSSFFVKETLEALKLLIDASVQDLTKPSIDTIQGFHFNR